MAGKVKFFRGTQGTNLPEQKQDGHIYIVERDAGLQLGDIYVDISDHQRIHIAPESDWVEYDESMNGSQSTRGIVYVSGTYIEEDGQQKWKQLGVRIGDGKAFIGDLPIYTPLTIREKDIWNSKVDAFMDIELYPEKRNTEEEAMANETLILTRNFYFNKTTGTIEKILSEEGRT